MTEANTQATGAAPRDPAVDLSAALQRAVEDAAPSVVRVASPRGHATSGTAWSSDGLILTSHRGIRRATELLVRGADERDREASVVGRDPGTDIALLRVDPDGLPAIARANPDELPKVGALTLALARPGWRVRASLRVVGVVGPGFRTHRGGRLDAWIETDRALPHGFSGGPLIDVHGRMLGLDTRHLVRHADLAIGLSTLDRTVAELLEHGAVSYGWLGITLVAVELPPDSDGHAAPAVLVTGIDPQGPAAAAGVLIGDIVAAVDGEAIDTPAGLRESLRGKVGEQVALTLGRAGANTSVDVTPSAGPNSD